MNREDKRQASMMMEMDTIRLTMFNPTSGSTVEMHFVRDHIVAFHKSLEKDGLTVVYTSDGKIHTVMESVEEIAVKK